jgi:hypothetical protein
LLAVLVVQIALILLIRGPFAHTDESSESRPLLPALESLSAAKVEIHGTEDKQVTLVREGADWVIEEAEGYPADPERVETLITTLKNLKVRRPIARSSRYHAALKLSDREHERRVRIWDEPSGRPKLGLYLGTSPNYRISHVRRDGEDAVYEVTGLGAFDLQQDVGGWIQTQLMDVDALAVSEVTVENASGRFTVAKTADGTWAVAFPTGRTQPVDPSKVVELIRVATLLTATEPAGRVDEAKHGFQRPAATMRLVVRGAADDTTAARPDEVTLRVGGQVEGQGEKRYVSISKLDHTAIVDESSVQKLIEQKLADLR